MIRFLCILQEGEVAGTDSLPLALASGHWGAHLAFALSDLTVWLGKQAYIWEKANGNLHSKQPFNTRDS